MAQYSQEGPGRTKGIRTVDNDSWQPFRKEPKTSGFCTVCRSSYKGRKKKGVSSMRLRSLKHVIEVVNSLLHPKRITVLGSSALLAHSADLGEPGNALELSLDADLLVEPCDESTAAVAHEAIGEDSLFHKKYGVYVDLMRPEIVETFPNGWQKRCIFLEGNRSVRYLNPVDIALIKLILGREKDVLLLKSLIRKEIVSIAAIRTAYQRTPMNEREMFKAGRLLRRLGLECGGEYEESSERGPVVREVREGYTGARTGKSRPRRIRRGKLTW